MKDMLKFITCGSVDDGKSTLIGHILYEAKLLYADQEKALRLESKIGSREGKIDYSLLLDGLMAEREQGITIDVAYRFFSTPKRSFIVADTPGHEQYTRNMAVGASFAQLAVLLVDAVKGVLVQTRRHLRICNMMGIQHFIFAVNKMDLQEYRETRFREIEREIREMMEEFPNCQIYVVPVSATEGDNVTKPSSCMNWYQGKTVLEYLEQVDIERDTLEDEKGFSMWVQRVCRPNSKFRGFQGQISMGAISVGAAVTVYPGQQASFVKEIYLMDQKVDRAEVGQAVTIVLEDEIDVSRGSLLCSSYAPTATSTICADILWMDECDLVVGKNYWLQIGTQQVPAVVSSIMYGVDVNNGSHLAKETLSKNEIACCQISADREILYDLFAQNKELGAVILVDRLSHMTSACGVIKQKIEKENHLYWQTTDITRKLREARLEQKAKTIWLTGLSGSGKSTIANRLEKRLFLEGKTTMLLDGDNVRIGLNKDLGFSKEDRIENIRRVAEVAKLMNDAGMIVLVSFISPYEEDRRRARDIVGTAFREVYVDTPLEECIRRDTKGLYKKALDGEIKNFTGISSPYEVPEKPDVVVQTLGHSVEENVEEIIEALGLL